VRIDRNGLEVLDRRQCLDLLGRSTFGRVGITAGALPTILPVNYRLDGDEILVRTGAGTKLDAALRGAVVAFEVDHVDPVYHSGWSVVVTGVARPVTDPERVVAEEHAPVARWAPAGEDHLVAISTDVISGRRLDPAVGAGR
jgi:nitroimidazol reductase NimA-like FMN-containing flavoprotein (pyridoxamine 5'-phosphate oxidase superfamily)